MSAARRTIIPISQVLTKGGAMYEYDTSDEELPKRNPVYSRMAGGVLDLDEDDLGHPEIPDLWQRLLADKRPVPERGLWCPTCYKSRPQHPEWMYVYERGDGLKIAAHHNRGHRAHTSEGPEHLAYKERIATAAELGGFRAELEVRGADGKVRTDVQVIGADDTEFGFEPQLSYRTDQDIRRRDRVRRQYGITPVWHVTDRKAPLIDRVSWMRTDDFPAEVIRDPKRALMVGGGVYRLELAKCDHRSVVPCPVKKMGRCGQYHPAWHLVGRHLLDDLVRWIAAGEFVPVVEKAGSRTRWFWTSAQERQQYVDNGGLLIPADVAAASARMSRDWTETPRQRDVQCTKDRRDGFLLPSPNPPRDSGESLRPAVTIAAPDARGRMALSAQLHRRMSELSADEVRMLADQLGCSSQQMGPCGRCYGPTVRYGVGAKVLCSACRGQ